MCGIVGATTHRPITNLLINGLKKLEYRGYDSAGIALMQPSQEILRVRVLGKVDALQKSIQSIPNQCTVGIAHTRWATHGIPDEKNAHPFISHDAFALVHNGIIENHAELRHNLEKLGYEFQSDTDTEVIVHLLHAYYQKHEDFLIAVQHAVSELKGAYAIAALCKWQPDTLIAVRHGSPLVVGIGQGEHFVASDPLALLSVTQQFIYLEEDDTAVLTQKDVVIYDKAKQLVKRTPHRLSLQDNNADKGEFRHFMLKEIMEQPTVLKAALAERLHEKHILPNIFGATITALFPKLEHVQLVACGTSFHACLVARYWIEAVAGIPCSVEIASEFRYREQALSKNSLFVALSQSGETADTLAALRLANRMSYLSTLAICNVPESSMTREAHASFLTHAGLEIGVASTKAFMTQLSALMLLTLTLALAKNKTISPQLLDEFENLPKTIQMLLKQEKQIAEWATSFTHADHALFVGRGALYPIALEGALKMKEISYIHAEGYPAGELKHGPLALVDHNMPVIALLPEDSLFEKTLSNLSEIRARSGRLFVFTSDMALKTQDTFKEAHFFSMPKTDPLLIPLVYTVPLQLLAYYVAVQKGTDVDQPRNLAKSVTVE